MININVFQIIIDTFEGSLAHLKGPEPSRIWNSVWKFRSIRYDDSSSFVVNTFDWNSTRLGDWQVTEDWREQLTGNW